MVEVRVGTSGWSYDHWEGCFYPANVPKSRWLNHYLNYFDTVELNASFYRLPKRTSFGNWYNKTPEGFLWSVKANRYITHIKKLEEPAETLERFYESVSALGEKLGAILFQLPPSLSFQPLTLDNFCKSLKSEYRSSLEVKHPSWIDEEMFNILRKYNVALCISDTAGRFPYHEEVTADFIYILIAELVYGKKPSSRDPARFSFAHGGKDGHPYPVDRENYDRSISLLKNWVSSAKVDWGEKVAAIKRLDHLTGWHPV